MRNKFLFCLIFTCVLLPTVYSQTKQEITVEWIYSNKSREITTIPRYLWLKNNTAIIQDLRKPSGKRTFEILNPKSGKRSPAVNLKKALTSLNSFREDSPANSLSWPLSFDQNGKNAVYLFDGDIFLLNLQDSQFEQITKTDESESSVNFSPNGKLLSFVQSNDLYIYDIKKRTEQRLTLDGSETLLNGTLSWVYWEEIFGRRDIGYWWSDDSKAIAYLQSDESNVSVMHYVHYEPAVPRVIKQRYPKAGTENPIVRIGIAKIGNGKTTWVDLDENNFEYVARVKWLPDHKRLAVQTMNRSQTELDLYFVDRINGKTKLIMTEKDEGWVNINDDFYFMGDGNSFIWQSERDGYAHLYRFSLEGELINQITKGEWALRSSGGVFWLRQSVVAIDEKRGWIYFTALKKSSIERHLYRINLDGKKMEHLSRADGTHRISFSPNAEYYFDSFSDIHSPPSLSLYKNNGSLKLALAEPRKELVESLEFQYPELFTIPTANGFQMPAEILKPKNFDPNQKYPIIFHIYAGPSAPTVFNSWNTARYFDQILLRKGYLVVRFDHPASTAISKNLENRVVKMMSGPIELKDIIDGVKWLKSQPYVDAERFGIWGWSGGGSFTLNAMTNSPEFKAGISVAPVTDWKYYDTKWTEFAMKRPQDNPDGYAKTSFVKSAKNLHGRLLLVHGTYDDNVHPQNSWRFIEELIQSNIQFDMMFYPMRKHGISDRPARIHLFTRMLEFWSKNL